MSQIPKPLLLPFPATMCHCRTPSLRFVRRRKKLRCLQRVCGSECLWSKPQEVLFRFALRLALSLKTFFLQGHPIVREADARFLSHVASCLLVLKRTEARPLRLDTWAGLRARRYDRPRRLCPLPVVEAHQAEMRSQIEETTPNVVGADTADLAFVITDLSGSPDPVFLVLESRPLTRIDSTSRPFNSMAQ